eukprot:TRINITY_DN4347_c0_g1_i10.p1 TRINITY_DN4347_c0_g1~~TRINITY_DN4347_c0_g1_i10.p1  ORF type:complete len:502 (-),score=18.30 TRINITY_DN4347_c0_g1_i10:36-1541(-)
MFVLTRTRRTNRYNGPIERLLNNAIRKGIGKLCMWQLVSTRHIMYTDGYEHQDWLLCQNPFCDKWERCDAIHILAQHWDTPSKLRRHHYLRAYKSKKAPTPVQMSRDAKYQNMHPSYNVHTITSEILVDEHNKNTQYKSRNSNPPKNNKTHDNEESELEGEDEDRQLPRCVEDYLKFPPIEPNSPSSVAGHREPKGLKWIRRSTRQAKVYEQMSSPNYPLRVVGRGFNRLLIDTENIIHSDRLGAHLYPGLRFIDGFECAVKLFTTEDLVDGETNCTKDAMDEIGILNARVGTTGLVHNLGIVKQKNKDRLDIAIVLELMEGSLKDLLNKWAHQKWLGTSWHVDICRYVIGGILTTLSELATIRMNNDDLKVTAIHGNIRPENILFDPLSHVRLAISAWSCEISAEGDEHARTPTAVEPTGFTAPEAHKNLLCPTTDLYSLGLVLFYMITGLGPSPYGDSHDKQSCVRNVCHLTLSLRIDLSHQQHAFSFPHNNHGLDANI